MLNEKELKERFTEFLNKYENGYYQLSGDYDFLEMSIPTYLLLNYQNAYKNPRANDKVFYQIFSAIDALPQEINPYYQFMKIIEKEFGLERDIIDVGGGMFPALSLEIAKRQKEIGKGTITCYDPELVTTTLDGITLKKEKFTLSSSIPENALIIGQKPCEATETIIRTSSIKNLEVFVQLCACTHNVPREYRLSHTETKNLWYSYIQELAEDTLPEGFSLEKGTMIDPLAKIQQESPNYKLNIEDPTIMIKRKK